MTLTFTVPVEELSLIIARLAGFMLSAPFFSMRALPVRIRGALVAGMGIFLWGVLPAPKLPSSAVAMAGALMADFMMGLSMGFVLQIMVHAMTSAGQLIAMEMGFAFSNMVDPSTGESATVIARIFSLAALLLFVLFGGHRMALRAIVASFVSHPPGFAVMPGPFVLKIVSLGKTLFDTAFRMALPITTAVLLTHISIALAARIAPRLNVFMLGFAAVILIGMFTLTAVLPSMHIVFRDLLTRGFEILEAISR